MQEVSIPEQKHFNGVAFPLVLTGPKGGGGGAEGGGGKSDEEAALFSPLAVLTEWLQTNRTELDSLLLRHKGILFRGFNCLNAENLHDVIEASQLKSMDYIGGAAVRTQLTSRVFTANESPASEKIPFHHEMAQTPDPPTHLFFFCEVPPSVGGETPILISSEVCKAMDAKHPEFMQTLEEKGVRYRRVMPTEDDPTSAIGRGWKSTYLCSTQEEAEMKLAAQGTEFEWVETESGELNCVTTTAIIPGVRYDTSKEEGVVRTNEKQFFNSLVAAYTGWNDSRNTGKDSVLFGDGTPCASEPINDAVALMDDLCVAFRWETGDVLLLDNRTAMHSRRPYEGPRRILASLARDHSR